MGEWMNVNFDKTMKKVKKKKKKKKKSKVIEGHERNWETISSAGEEEGPCKSDI